MQGAGQNTQLCESATEDLQILLWKLLPRFDGHLYSMDIIETVVVNLEVSRKRAPFVPHSDLSGTPMTRWMDEPRAPETYQAPGSAPEVLTMA